MSEQFKYAKLNLERTEQNLKARKSEFVYRDSKGVVPENKTYSVYYLTSKTKLFFTKLITSKVVREILRVNYLDTYDIYLGLKRSSREIYPSNFFPELKEKDYKSKLISRFFIQKANDRTTPVLEISEADYNKQLTLYNKVRVNWTISGTKEEVAESNLLTINNTNKVYKGIDKLLYPLQYWRPPKNSPEDIAKKMLFLKN